MNDSTIVAIALYGTYQNVYTQSINRYTCKLCIEGKHLNMQTLSNTGTCSTDSAYLMMPSSYGDDRLVPRVESIAKSGHPHRDTEVQPVILDLKYE